MADVADLLWEADQEESFERRLLSGRLVTIRRTTRSALCKAGKHDLCDGLFVDRSRDPVAHRSSGTIACGCSCHRSGKGRADPGNPEASPAPANVLSRGGKGEGLSTSLAPVEGLPGPRGLRPDPS